MRTSTPSPGLQLLPVPRHSHGMGRPRTGAADRNSLNRLVDDRLRQLEAEARARRDDDWTVKALEEEFELSNGALSKLRHGDRKSISSEVLPRVAAALGLSPDALLAAGPNRPAKPPSPAPPANRPPSDPPPSSVIPTLAGGGDEAEIDRLLDEAMSVGRHRWSHGAAVRPLVRDRATLLGPDDDVVSIIRVWLDAARRLLDRGQPATPGRILGESSRRHAEIERSA
jgi:transcriptional regulator with XRE-family HTH domain